MYVSVNFSPYPSEEKPLHPFSYKKLSERVRAKGFLNFQAFKGKKFLNSSFLTRAGIKTDIDLELCPYLISYHHRKADRPRILKSY